MIRNIALVAFMFLLMVPHFSFAQEYVPLDTVGPLMVFDSPPWINSQGRLMICGRGETNRPDVFEQTDKRTFVPSALKTSWESGYPVAPSEGGQWFGYDDQLTFVSADGKRIVFSPMVKGRETSTTHIQPIGGDSVLVTFDEYTVVRREIIDGVRFSWIDSITHRVELYTPSSREILLNDSVKAHEHYSNAVALGNGRYAVGMLGGDSIRQCLAVIEADRSVSFIDEPQYLEVDAYPTYLHVGTDGRLYSFLHLLKDLYGLWLPGYIEYDERSGEIGYRQIPDMFNVNHAVNVDDKIVAADDRGLLVFKDDTYRFMTALHPSGNFYARLIGVIPFDERTLAAYDPWGIRYYAIDELLPTGITESDPGVVVGPNGNLDVTMDPAVELTWQMIDLNGRPVMSGTKDPGVSQINVNTEGLSNGVFMLVVQRAGVVVHSQSILVQR